MTSGSAPFSSPLFFAFPTDLPTDQGFCWTADDSFRGREDRQNEVPGCARDQRADFQGCGQLANFAQRRMVVAWVTHCVVADRVHTAMLHPLDQEFYRKSLIIFLERIRGPRSGSCGAWNVC